MDKMKIIFAGIAIFFASVSAKAQSVSLLSDGKLLTIQEQQTQTEIKPGWKIVDIQLKNKIVRYLWGKTAKQFTTEPRPKFVVDTDTLLLSDMVLVKLLIRNDHRRLVKPEIHQNTCISLDLSTFSIEAHGDESFLIQPLQELSEGEYIFTWRTRKTVGELGDWIVWPFSVQ